MAIKLTKELLTAEPEELAKTICKKDSSTQIRRFYNDFLALKAKYNDLMKEPDAAGRCDVFSGKILPLIFFSKAKIAYAVSKEGSKLSREFAGAINKKIDAIETAEDFENFINYYQALIGYVMYYGKFAIGENVPHGGKKYNDNFNNRNNPKDRRDFRK